MNDTDFLCLRDSILYFEISTQKQDHFSHKKALLLYHEVGENLCAKDLTDPFPSTGMKCLCETRGREICMVGRWEIHQLTQQPALAYCEVPRDI